MVNLFWPWPWPIYKFPMVKMITLSFNHEFSPQNNHFDHWPRGRFQDASGHGQFFDHWPWLKFQGFMVMVSPFPSPPPPKFRILAKTNTQMPKKTIANLEILKAKKQWQFTNFGVAIGFCLGEQPPPPFFYYWLRNMPPKLSRKLISNLCR